MSKGFLQFKPGAADKMKHIENEIARTVAPYRENTEAAIVVFALIRVARLLLKLYPMKTRVVLRNECCDFLEEKPVTDDTRIVSIN